VRWAIVAGKRENDSERAQDGESARSAARSTLDEALDEARASGAVLIEQAG
jgi:hypothetical protein